MKKLLFFVPVIMAAYSLQAQDCSKNHPVFNSGGISSPNTVYRLGSDPEFPFLRNLSTPQQVVAAMNSSANRKKYPAKMRELDKMLKEIGFDNGAKDVRASNVTPYIVTPGTTGNMGSGHLTYSYTTFKGRSHKAWKVSSGDCYVAFLSTCGNAFYPTGAEKSTAYTGNKPQCQNEQVIVNSDPKQITLSDAPVVKKKTYIFYKKGCPCKDCGPGWSQAGYNEGVLSRPLLVKTEKETAPQTYKVTTSNSGNALICKGKTTEVTTDIVVEKENEYTGYKPEVKKEYIEVTRHEYKRTMRQKQLNADVMQRPAYDACTTCDYK